MQPPAKHTEEHEEPELVLSENALDHALADLLRRMDMVRGEPASTTSAPPTEIDDEPANDFPYNLFRRASALTREGHVCLDLNEHRELFGGRTMASIRRELLNHAGVGAPGEKKPLLLQGDRLYLYRYFRHEKEVVEEIIRRSRNAPDDQGPGMDSVTARNTEESSHPEHAAPAVDSGAEDTGDSRQAQVVRAMRDHGLLIVAGGPGTGKTTTIVRALAVLLREHPGMRLALTAPTGKAALRLRESVEKAAGRLDLEPDETLRLVENISTLHRLLGVRPGSAEAFHHRDRPLPLDLLLIDEASMIDLPLLARTLSALPPGARLVLAGDHHQLASVEAGSVLGDIFAAARDLREGTGPARASAFSLFEKERHALIDCIHELTHNYRFGDESQIAALSRAVNAGRAAEALKLLGKKGDQIRIAPDVGSILSGRGRYFPEDHPPLARLQSRILAGYGPALEHGDPLAALDAFDHFRILCALREGPAGVSTLNRFAEAVLMDTGLIHHGDAKAGSPHYPGRPILILRNDYSSNLFNGDTGMIREHEGRLRACFRDGAGGVRFLPLEHLPEHQTAFAMTVHKSQGSEFRDVVLVLPNRGSPVLTRELIYTGLTRAAESFEVFGQEAILTHAIKRRTRRTSGLREELLRHG